MSITIRQVKYLNTIVEQDHRAVKRVIGIELMHMIKKKQLGGETEYEDVTAAGQCYALAS